MGRQRNEETIKQIRRAVWQLFLAKGYGKTSFSDVAQTAQLNRSIVQYYFAKKEDFSNMLMAQVSDQVLVIVDRQFPDASRLERYYLASQLYFAVFWHPELRHLLKEILENRKLADESMYNQVIWSVNILTDAVDEAKFEAAYIDVVDAWGGFAEVMYYSLQHDRRVDLARGLKRLVPLIAMIAGYEATVCDQVIATHTLMPEQRDELRDRILQQLNQENN